MTDESRPEELKDRVAAAIETARSALDDALDNLSKWPGYDPEAIAFVTHALNNFLSVSQASIQLLRQRVQPPAGSDVERLIDTLEHTTHLMSHAVARLQGEPSNQKLRWVALRLAMLTQRVADYYRQAAARKGIRLEVEVAAGATVWSDGVAVAAILDNFLSNAIKFSPRDTIIRLQVTDDAGGVRFAVRDEGPGLSPEDQERLFEKGTRLTPTPTGDETSHGYGLAVAKHLSELIGGTIGCDSELGRGATFWLRLPVTEA